VLIEAMQHPDLAVVESEREGSVLRVDQIRDLQRSLNLYPYEARYRIALLLRFEEANANAMNALLKTLEEPPPQVVLMLTAASPEQLLPTIVSRCEILRLRSTPLDKVEVGLQELFGVDPERARMLAHVSAGRSGYALRLYQEPNLMQQRRTLLEDLSRLLEANRLDRFSYVEPLTKDKDSLRFTLLIWHSFWRDVFVQATGASAPVTNLDFRTEIASAAEKFSLDKSFRIASALERTINLLDSNINARLALEVLMLDMPHG
jgi:DNA polymerase-3 subunit delta'